MRPGSVGNPTRFLLLSDILTKSMMLSMQTSDWTLPNCLSTYLTFDLWPLLAYEFDFSLHMVQSLYMVAFDRPAHSTFASTLNGWCCVVGVFISIPCVVWKLMTSGNEHLFIRVPQSLQLVICKRWKFTLLHWQAWNLKATFNNVISLHHQTFAIIGMWQKVNEESECKCSHGTAISKHWIICLQVRCVLDCEQNSRLFITRVQEWRSHWLQLRHRYATEWTQHPKHNQVWMLLRQPSAAYTSDSDSKQCHSK